jgi:hypothetical protein
MINYTLWKKTAMPISSSTMWWPACLKNDYQKEITNFVQPSPSSVPDSMELQGGKAQNVLQ